MIGDISQASAIIISEYTDDIIFYCHEINFNELKAITQKQMDDLYKWTEDWGLKINVLKTKVMLFTDKKLGNPTHIKLNDKYLLQSKLQYNNDNKGKIF